MILGNGPLSDGARKVYGEVPFTWILYQSPLPFEHMMLEFINVPDGEVVVLSTPSRVGMTAICQHEWPRFRWAYVPENVREAHPEDWKTQERFIIGTRDAALGEELSEFFKPAIVMSPESAEMVKHALNGFLALSVAYAKEIARLCEQYGADADDVSLGLRTDPRIGQKAYLRPRGEAGPHLMREVDNLLALGAGKIVQACK